ncbi:hypothetical protein [Arenicella chitinivorans]|uniref:hypothetical protein n=1 Tax=Arenicella chitinivorans TaxID=1329800 RepID=UPI00167732E1|nr:hypothetical protein [Arenicella chitinivorans]
MPEALVVLMAGIKKLMGIIGWFLSGWSILALGTYLIPQYLLIKEGTAIPGEYHLYLDEIVTEKESIEMLFSGVVILVFGALLIWVSRRTTNKSKHYHSLRSLGRAKDARPCLRR